MTTLADIETWYGRQFEDGREVLVAKVGDGNYAFWFVNQEKEVTNFLLSAEATEALVGALLKVRMLG